MKIKKDYIERFIKKASLNGSIMAINMEFTDTGILSSVTDLTNIALTKTSLSKDKFEDYKNIGEIFVKNTTGFLKAISTFQGDITLELVDDYMLSVSNDEREGYIILGSKLVCENKHTGGLPDIKHTAVVNLNKSAFSKTTRDMKELGINLVGIRKKGDLFTLEVGIKGESDFFIDKYKIKGEGEGYVEVGDTIIKLLESLEGDFILSFGNKVPILVNESSDGIEFNCIIAPLV